MISIGVDDNKIKDSGKQSVIFSSWEKSSDIHESAKKYDFHRIRELLNENVNVNERDSDGRTPLHILLFDGFLGHLYENDMVACVQVLLEFNADVNASDSDGNTPLSLAVQNVFAPCTKILLENGARTSAKIAASMALSMPDVLLELFDNSITAKKDDDGKVLVQLDWRPILQFPERPENHQRFKHVKKETEFLYSLLEVKVDTRSKILKHPLIEAFVHFKSSKMANWFRLMYFISLLYPIFYMIFIYFLYFEKCAYRVPSNSLESNGSSTAPSAPIKPFTHCDITVPIAVASYLLATVILAWGLAELFLQFRVERRYLTNWRVWVIRVTIIVMGFTLWPGLQINDLSYNITWQYPIASMGTFLAWIMFMIQVGLYQRFSIYLEMLVKILISVVKIILMFLPLFIGFFMGFNLMFSNMGGVFGYIMMSVDVGSDNYSILVDDAKEDALWFQILAYTFCVVFIIVIVIVFMNFLLALSIQDVEGLKGQAALTSKARQIQNLFVIDLVDASSAVVSEENRMKGIWTYTYCPSDPDYKLELSKETRMKITLLLKSKNLKRLNNERNKEELRTVQNNMNSGSLELMNRIQELEKKLDTVSSKVMENGEQL